MLRILAILVMFTSVGVHAADDPQPITWDDLMPQVEPIEDPFQGVSEELIYDIWAVQRGRSDLELGFIREGTEDHADLQKLEAGLSEKGIDVDQVLVRLAEAEAEIDRRGQLVVPELEGTVIRMPGYALPLEYSETGVTEFLLVPYVGACIHTPPPPPNQIVYVKTDRPHLVENLYDPVWITGQITLERSSRALSFVDGQADIATGYKLNAVVIEPYF